MGIIPAVELDPIALSPYVINALVACVYYASASIMLLLAGYVIRAETLVNRSFFPWRPFPPSIGWWLGFFFMSLFMLFVVLGFSVMISIRPVFLWGVWLTAVVGLAAIGLFFAFASVEIEVEIMSRD